MLKYWVFTKREERKLKCFLDKNFDVDFYFFLENISNRFHNILDIYYYFFLRFFLTYPSPPSIA